jgi:hypothetical protein
LELVVGNQRVKASRNTPVLKADTNIITKSIPLDKKTRNTKLGNYLSESKPDPKTLKPLGSKKLNQIGTAYRPGLRDKFYGKQP